MSAECTDDGEAFTQAEERFRLVVESSPAAIVIVNQDGRIDLVNRQAEAWFGYERQELLGKEIETLIPQRYHAQHLGDRDRFLAAPTERPMGVDHDLFARRKDGSEFPVDISLHPIETDDGVVVMAHIVDLTDRKRAALETQRRHAMERLALLGELAAGVAHEIRNPLGVIRNAAYYLQMIQDTLDRDARESIVEIQQEVDKANYIVGDLLDYARDAPQQLVTFDLAERLRALLNRHERLAARGTIHLRGETDSVCVNGDASEVDRILSNLVRNGMQASEEDGTITITLRTDAAVAIVEISDEGPGVSAENRDRIFDPLFTTKAKGIGLGLAVSRRYAERNGGALELIETAGPGATFRLTLPLSEGE